ncbi:hypothetical protein FTUN_5604 [Frigoriglobus tundricola]|uniref:Uncharacterized protein n=1 Tax=Frigoriglobus tundricola TaxID=2774151 RepID=A0A6M5YX31_9BACT|nr:hypothetical protein FTUN_5604 [Frigoriglobus tundricola]
MLAAGDRPRRVDPFHCPPVAAWMSRQAAAAERAPGSVSAGQELRAGLGRREVVRASSAGSDATPPPLKPLEVWGRQSGSPASVVAPGKRFRPKRILPGAGLQIIV